MIGVVCIPAPVWFSTGIFPEWSLWFAVPLLLLPVVFWLYERFLDSRTDIEDRRNSRSLVLERFEIIGRPRESNRVIEYGSAAWRCGYFRTTLRLYQQRVLMIMWGVILILRLWFHVSLSTVSLIASVAYAIILLQLFLSRCRYRVEPGLIIIDELSGLAVVDRRTVPLCDVSLKADFSEGVLHVTKPDDDFCINLNEMFNPHHFVGTVLAAAHEQESTGAPP